MAVSGDSFSSKIQCSQEGVQQPGHVLFFGKNRHIRISSVLHPSSSSA